MDSLESLERINAKSSEVILEMRALVEVMDTMEMANYPTNTLLAMVKRKLKIVFENVEENRRIIGNFTQYKKQD